MFERHVPSTNASSISSGALRLHGDGSKQSLSPSGGDRPVHILKRPVRAKFAAGHTALGVRWASKAGAR